MKKPFCSVIVSTYNRPDALKLVLASLAAQTCRDFEVIVADDGSTPETQTQVLLPLQFNYPVSLKYIWQMDEGFQAAKIRNKAALLAAGDYLIFLDGDCLVLPDFIKQQQTLAETGYWVAGNRVLLSEAYTQKVLADQNAIYQNSCWAFAWSRCQGQINRWHTLWRLPLSGFRKCCPRKWRGAKTCNLAVWKSDFMAVNGFDESFVGWGFEDSDLVIRLIQAGIFRKSGKFALPVLHLYHPEAKRDQAKANQAKLQERLHSTQVKATKGIDQHLYTKT